MWHPQARKAEESAEASQQSSAVHTPSTQLSPADVSPLQANPIPRDHSLSSDSVLSSWPAEAAPMQGSTRDSALVQDPDQVPEHGQAETPAEASASRQPMAASTANQVHSASAGPADAILPGNVGDSDAEPGHESLSGQPAMPGKMAAKTGAAGHGAGEGPREVSATTAGAMQRSALFDMHPMGSGVLPRMPGPQEPNPSPAQEPAGIARHALHTPPASLPSILMKRHAGNEQGAGPDQISASDPENPAEHAMTAAGVPSSVPQQSQALVNPQLEAGQQWVERMAEAGGASVEGGLLSNLQEGAWQGRRGNAPVAAVVETYISNRTLAQHRCVSQACVR